MELRDVEIKDVLRAIGQEHGLNIIVDESVKGKVTLSIKDIPLWDAIDSILKSKGYSYRTLESGIIIVKPVNESLRAEQELLVKEFRLKYLKPSEKVINTIKGLLSKSGKVTHVESTNSIIVKDLPPIVKRVTAMLKRLDTKPAQVMIEARIVELNTSYTKELGIEWGAGYATSKVFGSAGTLDSSFMVNLPSTETDGLAFSFGFVKSKVTLDAQLSALEESGVAKILSSPRIMVLENRQAAITSGTEILVPATETTATVEGLTTTQKPETLEAKLQLTVTPRTTENERISLIIDTKREEFDFSREIQGFPPKLTRTAKTELIVKNGETIVIGGIYTKNEATGESGVPWLSKIPIFGWLFKKQTKSASHTELLIFLTPTIIKEVQIQ
jgi:type IV pilus assembly protein PilQ